MLPNPYLKYKMVRYLPKLQRYFAEFLKCYYLIRLSILYLFTCVGFQYDLLGLSFPVFYLQPAPLNFYTRQL